MIARLVRWHLRAPGALFFLALSSAMVCIMPNLGAAPMLVLFVLMAQRRVPRTLTVFEATLPIRGRDLVLARVMATMTLVLVPVLVWGVAVMVSGDEDTPRTMIPAVIALATLVVLAPSAVARGAGRTGLANATPAVLAVGGGLVIWRLSATTATTLFTIGNIASLVVLWTTIDAAPLLAGSSRISTHRTGTVSDPADAAGMSAVSRVRLAWALLRSAISGNSVVFFIVLTAMGAIGHVVMFICLALIAVPGVVRARTRWLAALPLSHRARLLAIVIPSVGIAAACVGAGTAANLRFGIFDSLTSDAPSTSTPGHYFYSETGVSVDHWLRAPAAAPPVIVAPWGERVAADTASIFGTVRYNPFTSKKESSPRFVEWQFERATAEVYGVPLTQAQYDAGIRPHPEWELRWWLVNAAAFLTLALTLLLLSEPSYARPARAMWLPMLPMLAFLSATMYRVRHAAVVEPLLRGMLRDVAHAVPANPILALPLVAIPVLLVYLLLERRFARSELALGGKPTSPTGERR